MSENEKPGLRERKRRETLQRITDAGLRLFASKGYEATTLDAIAVEAGISRRTFFHYFKSKDDILLSVQQGMGQQLVASLAQRVPGESPLQALRGAALRAIEAIPLDELVVIDRLMMSSETVQASKQASYARDETVLFEGLKVHWPEEDEMTLRILAMFTIGMGRIALGAWRSDGGNRPLADYAAAAFDRLHLLVAK